MDPNPEDQALLRQYQNLPKSRRQAILRGILEQLRPEDWREIKAQAAVHTFQYDILGKLPLEIAALIAEALPLFDIIRLRRVSQRWQQVLSSPSLCRAAVRATLGKDPWALSSPTAGTIHTPNTKPVMDTHATGTLTSEPTLSSNTVVTASAADPSPDITSYSAASFMKIVKRRHRLEQGNPYKVTTILSPIMNVLNELEADPRTFVTYSDGSCAWLGVEEDQTTVVILNLLNDDRKKFTTENREKLCFLQFCKPFIAAVSIRGYCHVWNIDTSESSSFRIPSIDFRNILISGTKVLLQFEDYVVHWCFNTKIARTMKTGVVITLALHPSEDQITTICLYPKDERRTWDPVSIKDCTLRVEKYVLGNRNEWCLLSSPYQLPVSVSLEKATHFARIADGCVSLNSGQYNVAFRTFDAAREDFSRDGRHFCVSVEPDGLVAFHTFPDEVHDLTCPERGVLYAPRLNSPAKEYLIMKSKTIMDPGNSWIWYDYYIHHTKEIGHTPWIMGDARFITMFDGEKMDIWSMDEPDLRD